MAELARRIVLALYQGRGRLREEAGFREQIYEDLNELKNLERELSPHVYFSVRMESLVKQKNYSIEIPYSVLPLWQNHAQTNGTIYVFTSKKMPGCSKLGATTIDIEKRARLFSNRYGIPVEIAYAFSSYDPFIIERKVARVFSEFRINGNVYGSSNEWYKIDADLIGRQIEEYRIVT